MKKDSCCFNCDHRHIGCHAVCEDYIEEKKERERERAERLAGSKAFYDMESCEIKRSYRARKWRRDGK